MTCTEDPNAKDVGYGVTVGGGDSAWRLQVPTFTDQMRTSRKAHVVSLAIKARSAIMLGGHGGDAITWLTETLDGWETAAGYSENGVPAVKAFVDANPIAADFGKTWERSLPAASYQRAGRWRRRGAAAGMDAQLSACAEGHRRQGRLDLLRAVGAQPVRRRLYRPLRRRAGAVAAAR